MLIVRVNDESFEKKIMSEHNCAYEQAKEGISNYMGIYTIEYFLDYKAFFLKSDYEKKEITLNILRESINKIVSLKGWDSGQFHGVFDKIVELDYKNSWIWGKKVKSVDKIHTAEVYLEHKVNEIDIYICIRDKKDRIIGKKLILTELPHEFSYSKHLGKLVWISENEVQLNNKNGDKAGLTLKI